MDVVVGIEEGRGCVCVSCEDGVLVSLDCDDIEHGVLLRNSCCVGCENGVLVVEPTILFVLLSLGISFAVSANPTFDVPSLEVDENQERQTRNEYI